MIKKTGKQFFEVFAPSSSPVSPAQPPRAFEPPPPGGFPPAEPEAGPRLITIRLHLWAAAVIAILALGLLAIAYFWGFQRGKDFALAPRNPNIPDGRVPAGQPIKRPAAPAPRTEAPAPARPAAASPASLPGALAPTTTGISSTTTPPAPTTAPAPAPATEPAAAGKPLYTLCLITFKKGSELDAQALRDSLQNALGAKHEFMVIQIKGNQGPSVTVGRFQETTSREMRDLQKTFDAMPFGAQTSPFKGAYFVPLPK